MDLSAVGRQFGLDEQQTQAAFDAIAPVVAAGMRRSAESGGGLGDLLGALAGQLGNANTAQPDLTAGGNAVLGQIFGSKDVSRGVAQQLSATTGIGESILKKLMPIIAAMVMAQLAKKAGGGGLGDILGSVLGGGSGRSQGGGGLGDILGSVLGGGASGQSQGGGLGDILGGMLGGQQQDEEPARRPAQRPAETGSIDDMLRDILGGAGGGGTRASSADDLLRSVEQALGRR